MFEGLVERRRKLAALTEQRRLGVGVQLGGMLAVERSRGLREALRWTWHRIAVCAACQTPSGYKAMCDADRVSISAPARQRARVVSIVAEASIPASGSTDDRLIGEASSSPAGPIDREDAARLPEPPVIPSVA